jgi:hypothetical protein
MNTKSFFKKMMLTKGPPLLVWKEIQTPVIIYKNMYMSNKVSIASWCEKVVEEGNGTTV